jgi:hypothetical protein
MLFGRPAGNPQNVYSRFGSGQVPRFEGSVASAPSREGSHTEGQEAAEKEGSQKAVDDEVMEE